MENFGFKKELSQLRMCDSPKVIAELKEALNIKNPVTWWKRSNGHIEPKISEANKISAIFNKYGITKIWGE